MAMYTEEEYIQLSGIQHFAFCRRQWALIHVEQQWAENYQTTAGILMHKKAHDEMSVEKRGDLIIMRGLRISSRQLGLSGQCDVVPVEYKRGTEKDGSEDAVQLCAQAICLEEMFLTDIPKGYLFYGENKRRTEVIFDMTLRGQVEKLCEEMHTLYKKGNTPKVKTSKKCRSCSLKDLCLPKLNKKLNVERYIADRLGEGGAL